VGTLTARYTSNECEGISIQLVSPASGDVLATSPLEEQLMISIQLVSPASGDSFVVAVFAVADPHFHSISFPSEWGQPEHES